MQSYFREKARCQVVSLEAPPATRIEGRRLFSFSIITALFPLDSVPLSSNSITFLFHFHVLLLYFPVGPRLKELLEIEKECTYLLYGISSVNFSWNSGTILIHGMLGSLFKKERKRNMKHGSCLDDSANVSRRFLHLFDVLLRKITYIRILSLRKLFKMQSFFETKKIILIHMLYLLLLYVIMNYKSEK